MTMRSEFVNCIDCMHFSLRGHPGMASQGYGTCELDRRTGVFQSAIFDRTCAGFRAADPEIAARRRAWLDAQRAEFMKTIEGNP
ncbi:MAG: hypothetical protein WC997_18510 [Porticoccaceae bacterium]